MDLLKGCFNETVLYFAPSLLCHIGVYLVRVNEKDLWARIFFSATFEKVILKSLHSEVNRVSQYSALFYGSFYYCLQETELLFCFVLFFFLFLVLYTYGKVGKLALIPFILYFSLFSCWLSLMSIQHGQGMISARYLVGRLFCFGYFPTTRCSLLYYHIRDQEPYFNFSCHSVIESSIDGLGPQTAESQ